MYGDCFRLLGGKQVALEGRRAGCELVARQSSERTPGTEHRLVHVRLRIQVAVPQGNRALEPARVQAGGKRAFLQLGISGLEAEVLRGLEVF